MRIDDCRTGNRRDADGQHLFFQLQEKIIGTALLFSASLGPEAGPLKKTRIRIISRCEILNNSVIIYPRIRML